MKAAARPVLSAVRCRRYVTQAAEKRLISEPRTIRMVNGAVVAGLENHSPVARVAIVYNAGSRYETPEQVGITHALRIATNLGTKNATGFGITRNLQQLGADVTATTTREHMILTLTCMRGHMYDSLNFLSHIARHPAFKPWEVRDMSATLNLDVAMFHANSEARLFEALHAAAYRDTLARSLYLTPERVGTHDADDLANFSEQHFVPSNMAVVALGTDPEEFAFQLRQRWGWEKDEPKPVPTKAPATYGGGEVRVDTAAEVVQAAVVTEGASLGSKDLIPLALLQRIMGVGPSVKYSDNLSGSKLSQAIAEATSEPFAASALNINYSDSGLFGFFAQAPARSIGPVLRACAAAFGAATKGGLTEEDLTRAKSSLKAALHLALEDGETTLTEMGVQVLMTGQLTSPADICAEIDRTTLGSVQEVAKRVINGKPSMAAVGDLAYTPYLDQIL